MACKLDKDDRLTLIDPRGGQVADLLAYTRSDLGESISSGFTCEFLAEECVIVGLTACSALQSNDCAFKPIHYRITHRA